MKSAANICSLTEGATTPETFVPFGHELDMVSRTENLYDKNNASMNFLGYVNNTTFAVVSSSRDSFSIIVPVEPNTTYTVVKPTTSRFRVGLFTSYPYVGEVATAIYGDRDGNGVDRGTSLTFTTSSNTSYILAFVRNYDDAGATNDQMKNSTVVFKVSITPIYIGNEPLYENEYVDYTEQEVYRRTANFFNAEIQRGFLSTTDASERTGEQYNNRLRSGFMPEILPMGTYTIYANGVDNVSYRAYNDNKTYVYSESLGSWENLPYTFTLNAARYIRFVFRKRSDVTLQVDNISNVMLIAGTIQPETYTPYLQPTDPPISLPALPTCDGTTVIDYIGSGTAPEKVMFKYRKEGF